MGLVWSGLKLIPQICRDNAVDVGVSVIVEPLIGWAGWVRRHRPVQPLFVLRYA